MRTTDIDSVSFSLCINLLKYKQQNISKSLNGTSRHPPTLNRCSTFVAWRCVLRGLRHCRRRSEDENFSNMHLQDFVHNIWCYMMCLLLVYVGGVVFAKSTAGFYRRKHMKSISRLVSVSITLHNPHTNAHIRTVIFAENHVAVLSKSIWLE